MSADNRPDRPEPGKRRPRPAHDANVDPIEPAPAPAPASAPAAKVRREPFTTAIDPDVRYILNRVKLEENLKIYEALEQAIVAHWGHKYGRK
ncbi:hypothetical protein GCM10022377_20800 [Zhihengliuella alba]|uniref:Partitioning protein ParB n=1 Tax=Zhihengliuella alba TaxID=547018 RepID=A0ABP7DR28_9MICC